MGGRGGGASFECERDDDDDDDDDFVPPWNVLLRMTVRMAAHVAGSLGGRRARDDRPGGAMVDECDCCDGDHCDDDYDDDGAKLSAMRSVMRALDVASDRLRALLDHDDDDRDGDRHDRATAGRYWGGRRAAFADAMVRDWAGRDAGPSSGESSSSSSSSLSDADVVDVFGRRRKRRRRRRRRRDGTGMRRRPTRSERERERVHAGVL